MERFSRFVAGPVAAAVFVATLVAPQPARALVASGECPAGTLPDINGECKQAFDSVSVKGTEWPDHLFLGNTIPSTRDPRAPGGREFARNRGQLESGDYDATVDCGQGNPIVPSSGNKVETELDFATSGEMPLFLERKYSAHWKGRGLFGYNWVSNFDLRLKASPDGATLRAYRIDGRIVTYTRNAAPALGWSEEKGEAVSRILPDGAGGYVLSNEGDQTERYDAAGRITRIANAQGVGIAFTYDASGQMTRATHTSGRYVQFAWTDGYVTSVIDPAGSTWTFLQGGPAYGAKRLVAVIKPGTPSTTHQYHYELAAFPGALTGKSLDGARYATFTYDAQGWATSSERAGGLERHTFAYTREGSKLTTRHTNPLGKQTTSVYIDRKLVSVTGHAATYCPGTQVRYVTYDANGNRDLETDFAGNITDSDYNAKGQLVTLVEGVDTPARRATSYEWDPTANRLRREILWGVRETVYDYDSEGRPSAVHVKNHSTQGVAWQVRTTRYSYTRHWNGMLASRTVDGPLAGEGDAITETWDAMGNLTSVRNALGHATTYSNFTGNGLPRRIVTPNGGTTDFTYDARGRVLTTTRWTAGVAATTHMAYDARDNLTSVATPDGVVTRHAYDAVNRLVETWRDEVVAPAPAAMAMEASSGETGEGAAEVHHFSAISPMACKDCDYEDREPAPKPPTRGQVESVVAYGSDVVLRGWACTQGRTDATTVHLYVGGPAGIGYFVVATPANQYSEPYVGAQCGVTSNFHGFAIPLTVDFRNTHAGKLLYVYALSPVGGANPLLPNSGVFSVPAVIDDAEFVAQTVPAAMTAGASYAVRVQMRNTGNTTWSTSQQYHLGAQDPNGNARWGLHQASLAADVPPGGTGTFDFTITAPMTLGAHAFRWRMVRQMVAWFGAQTPLVEAAVHPVPKTFERYTYNSHRQVTVVESGRVEFGHAMVTQRRSTDYDELGRVRAVRGNNGQDVRTTYDNEGNVATVTDALGHRTTYAYDARNRLVQTRDANGGVTTLAYDNGDQLVGVTDPAGRTTTYAVDGFGQRWREDGPATGTTQYAFDAGGLLTAMIRNDGSRLDYEYDALGRLTRYGDGSQSRTYGYDTCTNGLGLLCTATAGTRSTQFQYTVHGEVQDRFDQSPGTTDFTGYAFDAGGRLASVTYPSGVRIDYGYGEGRLHNASVTFNGATHALVAATGTLYVNEGLFASVSLGNGLKQWVGNNHDGSAERIATMDGDTFLQDKWHWYDAAGDLITLNDAIVPSQSRVHAYDALSRVTVFNSPSDAHGLTVDAVANRKTETHNGLVKSYTYVPGTDRVAGIDSAWGGITFAYDQRGNRTGAHWTTGSATHAYDAFNRHVAFAKDGVSTHYVYNALDQRVAKQNATTTSRYVYAGQNTLLAEHTNGTWTSYLWFGGRLIGLVRNNQLYFVSSDHLGRPELVTNANRQIVWRANNEAFGRKVTADAIGGLHIGFPGQYYDTESGLAYNGYRDYDELTGGYTQADPAGLRGGTNAYAYVGGSPITRIDPYGLWEVGVELFVAYGGGVRLACAGGTCELTGRIGVGIGGGINIDPAGAPSDHAEPCNTGLIARTSVNASAGVGLGPLGRGVSVTGATENVIKPGRGDSYLNISPWLMTLDGSGQMKFGAKLGIDVSAEFGAYW